MIKVNNPFFYLLIIYFVIVLMKIILSSLVPYPLYLSDERQYVEMSRSFLTQSKFLFEEKPSSQYPPLYPIFILPTSFFEKPIATPFIKIMNTFVTSSIIFPVYLISREFLNKKKALTVATLSLFIPESFVFTFTIMSENLFFPLVMFSIYFMLKSFTENYKKWDILCGLFIGLSILTRMIGLTLLVAIILILFIKILNNNKNWKWKIKKLFSSFFDKWLLFLILFLIIIPWIFRNIYYLGFNITSFLGGYHITETSKEFVLINTELVLNFIKFFFISTGYIVFGNGILFFALTIFLSRNLKFYRNNKLFNLVLITWVVFSIFILISTYLSFTDIYGRFTGKPVKIMGRYLASVLPIFLITGSIGLNLYKNKDKEILIILLFCSLVLTLLPTGKLITSFDTLSTLMLFIPEQLYKINILPLEIFNVKLILITLPFILFFGRKYFLKWRYGIVITFLFLITSSSIATIAISIGSYDAKEYMEFALWMRSNITTEKIILIDKRQNDQENELMWMIEAAKFWTDNKIIVKDITTITEDVDYVLSTHDLKLQKIAEFKAEEGLFEPKTELIFLYKK